MATERTPHTTPQIDNIPTEWLKVLDGFKNTGAPDAVIAGDGLSAVFNKHAPNDVHLFMEMPGNTEKQIERIQSAFAFAGVRIKEQDWCIEYTIGEDEKLVTQAGHGAFPPLTIANNVHFIPFEPDCQPDLAEAMFCDLNTWEIIAGDNDTAYHVSYITSDSDWDIKWPDALLATFDTGISRVATDGQKIFTHEAYDADIRNKTITLIDQCTGTNDWLLNSFSQQEKDGKIYKSWDSGEHLERLRQTYPDWTLDGKANIILNRHLNRRKI